MLEGALQMIRDHWGLGLSQICLMGPISWHLIDKIGLKKLGEILKGKISCKRVQYNFGHGLCKEKEIQNSIQVVLTIVGECVVQNMCLCKL